MISLAKSLKGYLEKEEKIDREKGLEIEKEWKMIHVNIRDVDVMFREMLGKGYEFESICRLGNGHIGYGYGGSVGGSFGGNDNGVLFNPNGEFIAGSSPNTSARGRFGSLGSRNTTANNNTTNTSNRERLNSNEHMEGQGGQNNNDVTMIFSKCLTKSDVDFFERLMKSS